MGHDHHFLSRLDRVSHEQVELALSIYRDHELVRAILDRSKLPEGAARVALAMDDATSGPYIVVARDGHFVTCLGEGMSTGQLPIVTRRQLDVIAADLADLRARIAIAKSLVKPGQSTEALLDRIYKAGCDLSREEFLGISSMRPMMLREFWKSIFEFSDELQKALPTLLRMRGKIANGHLGNALLREYWNGYWAVQHLLTLVADTGKELFDPLEGPKFDALRERFGFWVGTHGTLPSVVRAAWAVGRVGKPLLAAYVRRNLGPRLPPMLSLEGAFGLGVMAMRHPHLAPEIKRFLASRDVYDPARVTDRGEKDEMYAQVHRDVLEVVERWEKDPSHDAEIQAIAGRAHGEWLASSWPEGDARRRKADDVPLDVAMTLGAQFPYTLGDERGYGLMLACLPWAARAKAEEFYLPKAVLDVLKISWSAERTFQLFRWREASLEGETVRRAKTPGRNDPCSCGSGKKFKKCCGG